MIVELFRWPYRPRRDPVPARRRPATAASFLEQLVADPNFAWLHFFIQTLQAIVAGSRDRALADAPDMYYRNAAEILFLIETLEKRRAPHPT